MLRRIFPISMLLALVWGFGIPPSRAERLQRPDSFDSPQSPTTSGKISTGMIAYFDFIR